MTTEIASVLGRAGIVSVGVVFAYSVAPKLRKPRAFAEVVAKYELVPPALMWPASLLVIFAELIAAILLTTGIGTFIGVPIAVVTLATFAVAVLVNLRRGRAISCGCFGSSSERISVATVARLFVLVAVVVVAYALIAVETPGAGSPMPNTADGEILQQVWIILAGSAIVLIGLLASSSLELQKQRPQIEGNGA